MRTTLFNILTGASLVAAAPTQLTPRASKVQYAGTWPITTCVKYTANAVPDLKVSTSPDSTLDAPLTESVP